jgi:hypothetical protein
MNSSRPQFSARVVSLPDFRDLRRVAGLWFKTFVQRLCPIGKGDWSCPNM